MEQILNAGPIRCKYADGELRYVTYGTTELVRRIFFAVRTKTWDTLTPQITHCDIARKPDSFTITLAAVCEREATGYDSEGAYGWIGQIEGKSDGTIVFRVSGAPRRDFETNRIGICVLFGTPSVCGKPYSVRGKDGTARTGSFPPFVNAPLMFEPEFTELSYDNIRVQLGGAGIFSMEDQRNFADSSFKAYAVMPYDYPKLTKGQELAQTVTLSLSGLLPAPTPAVRGNRLTLGTPVAGARLPEIRFGSTGERNWFHGINHDREKTKAAPSVSFAYFPTEHLYDDETCWENVPVITELAESARQFAPDKPLDLHHIALTLTHPRPAPEPRNARPMGAAWAALCLKHAALAGVRSTTFDMGPGYANRLLKLLQPRTGQPLRRVSVQSPELVAPLDAYGLGESVIVVNKTGKRVTATLEGLPGGKWEARELHGQTPAGMLPPLVGVHVSKGSTNLNLAPHEVRILTRR